MKKILYSYQDYIESLKNEKQTLKHYTDFDMKQKSFNLIDSSLDMRDVDEASKVLAERKNSLKNQFVQISKVFIVWNEIFFCFFSEFQNFAFKFHVIKKSSPIYISRIICLTLFLIKLEFSCSFWCCCYCCCCFTKPIKILLQQHFYWCLIMQCNTGVLFCLSKKFYFCFFNFFLDFFSFLH